MWLWSSTPRKQSSCLWLMYTWRVPGLSWAARWTSTAASTGNQCRPGDSSVTEESGGQLWELWFLPGLESLFLFKADVENKQVTGGVSQHHPQCGYGVASLGSVLNCCVFLKSCVFCLPFRLRFTWSSTTFIRILFSATPVWCNELSALPSDTVQSTWVCGTGEESCSVSYLPSQHAFQN